jgi:hypothetical protein
MAAKKKEEKPKDKPKEKKQYTVVVEGIVPVRLTLDVIAEDEKEALKISEQGSAKLRQPPEFSMPKLRKIKTTVKEFPSSLIKLVKNF